MTPAGTIDPARLATHADLVRQQLALLRLPAANWPVAKTAPDGSAAYDVVIVGAGMHGIAAAGALFLKGVRNILLLERSAPGEEGPWLTFARMPTLRSPKELPGPALGIPALTYRAWHEAAYGTASWEALYKIWNADWVAYLNFVREALDLPIRHRTEVKLVQPIHGMVQLHLADGSTLWSNRVVLATGRGGAGGNALPSFVDKALWPDLAAHTNEPIDFDRLKGKSIAVIGAGPSAFDNAATALELGAAKVDLFARRKILPQVNKGRGSAYPGFLIGWQALPLAERWSVMTWLDEIQGPVPHETIHRAIAQKGFHIHLGTAVAAISRRADQVLLRTADGTEQTYDFAIIGTGFRIDPNEITEFGPLAQQIQCWRDIYTPPPAEQNPGLGAFPYLGPGFQLQERNPGSNPGLSQIHLFNYGAHATQGAIASDIPGANIGAERLADAIIKSLFAADFTLYRQRLEDWNEPELLGTPFHVAGG